MKNSSLTLYLEINSLSFVFFVGESDKYDNFKIVDKLELPLQNIHNNKITDLDEVASVFRKNIYIIEQKLKHTFKEIVLILENFELTFINFSGFKKLNGSQILNENITYIMNTLKSCVQDVEIKKTVLHIFNSKFYLDNKKIENIPIGLFGDFYSHELSFSLINKNDHKNLKSIFNNCNLKIKKILVKSFVEGVNLSDKNENVNTFFQIKINNNSSKIFYFENNSLKFEHNFKFGSDVVIKDISKIISLEKNIVKIILEEIILTKNILKDETIDKKFFSDNNNRKIKKKLIYDIAFVRIKEILDLILFTNINFNYYSKFSKNIFLEISDKSHFKTFREIYETTLFNNNCNNFNFIDNLSNENMLNSAHKLVHFGWKKEAIPVAHYKKSLIARFFEAIFG